MTEKLTEWSDMGYVGVIERSHLVEDEEARFAMQGACEMLAVCQGPEEIPRAILWAHEQFGDAMLRALGAAENNRAGVLAGPSAVDGSNLVYYAAERFARLRIDHAAYLQVVEGTRVIPGEDPEDTVSRYADLSAIITGELMEFEPGNYYTD